ncbi:MAG: hypothetical protein QXO27_03550 [Candidatus Aenigmatarchaeota archaeon]
MKLTYTGYDRLVENLVDALQNSCSTEDYIENLIKAFKIDKFDGFVYVLNSLNKSLNEKNLIGTDVAVRAILTLSDCFGQSQR